MKLPIGTWNCCSTGQVAARFWHGTVRHGAQRLLGSSDYMADKQQVHHARVLPTHLIRLCISICRSRVNESATRQRQQLHVKVQGYELRNLFMHHLVTKSANWQHQLQPLQPLGFGHASHQLAKRNIVPMQIDHKLQDYELPNVLKQQFCYQNGNWYRHQSQSPQPLGFWHTSYW
jgi:hypothetical protein